MKNNNFGVDVLKEFVEKLKDKSFYIHTAEDTYHVIDLATVYAILKEYVKND